MNTKPFDDGFFAGRAEGNLPFTPGSFLRSPTVTNRKATSWAVPFINRASINSSQDMRTMSCPPPVTLNSFAAFAADSPSGFDPSNPADVAAVYGDGFVGPTVEQAGFVPTSSTAVQPGAVKGNSILDAISGVIKAVTPAATSAATAALTPTSNPTSAKSQKQLMALYLAGQLPNYTINAAGQVVPKANTPAAPSSSSTAIGIGIAAVVGLGLVMVLSGGNRGSRRR